MNHIGPIRIETERLVLRPFSESDAQSMFDNWASDPEVTKFLTWPTHESVEVTRKVIGFWSDRDNLTNYNWCIALKSNDEAIGSIAVVSIDEESETLEIGYCISRRFWRQGVTAEAAKALISALFENVGAKRIIAKHDLNNPNSGRVMRKAGMHFLENREAENNTGACTCAVYAIDRMVMHPLTDAHKREICAWRYEGEYAVYNQPSYEEMATRGAGFMNAAREKNFHGFSVGDRLVGFVNIHEELREVFIGVGVHPDFCNQGYGRRILDAAADYVRRHFPGKPLYLEVRTWNERAIRCYQRAGFAIVTEPFIQTTGSGKGTFYKMLRVL